MRGNSTVSVELHAAQSARIVRALITVSRNFQHAAVHNAGYYGHLRAFIGLRVSFFVNNRNSDSFRGRGG